MRLPITLILLLATAHATAAIYKWTKPDGSVSYSDRPPVDNASPADLPPVQEITIVPRAAGGESAAAGDESGLQGANSGTETYTQLAITSPEDQGVVHDNAGNVTVSINLAPPLQPGDKLAILLDGQQVGQGAGTSISLSNVERGTHTLQVAVQDTDGHTMIESPTVTFTLLRTSLLQPRR